MIKITCSNCTPPKPIEKPKPKPKPIELDKPFYSKKEHEKIYTKIIRECSMFVSEIAYEMVEGDMKKFESMSEEDMREAKSDAIYGHSGTFQRIMRNSFCGNEMQIDLMKKVLNYWRKNPYI